jgi:hypothetical protein
MRLRTVSPGFSRSQVPFQPHPEVEGGLFLKELVGASAQTDQHGYAEFASLAFTPWGQVGPAEG